MNDRFKFRVWDKGNKRYQGTQDWQPYLDTDGDVCFINTDDVRDYPPENYFIIEQCTGLKDKNGNLIYEGDIVKIPDDYETYGFMSGEKREVYFRDGGFRLKPKDAKLGRGHWLEQGNDLEIIGNIHEQAEQKDK